jgi:hypothetical protein
MRLQIISMLVLAMSVSHQVSAAPAPDFSWVRRAGGSGGGGDVTATVIDLHGNVFVTGQVHGPAAFGSALLNSGSNSFDGFISKLDSRGTWLWTRQIAATNTQSPYIRPCAIALDPAGNVIITGESAATTASAATFGTNTFDLASCEIFVAKYSPEGECLWARATGGFDETYDHGVAVDGDGNIYIGGEFLRSTNFLVLKLDGNGNELLRINADSGWLSAHDIALDAGANIYICGTLRPPAQIQGTTLANATTREAFVAKFDLAGNLVWAREGGGNNPYGDNSWALGLALDSRTNILVCGTASSSILFGTPLTSHAGPPFVAKFAPDGTSRWVKTANVTATVINGAALDIALDSADNAYIAGWFKGTIQFDTTALSSVGDNNIFVGQCDPGGQFQWAIRDGGANTAQNPYDGANSIAVDSHRIVTVGHVPAAGSFGSITFTNPPGWQMFIAAIDFPPPTLSLAAMSSSLTLTWPAVPAGYVLEDAPTLAPGAIWSTNTPAPTMVQGTNYLTLPANDAQRFFRLRLNEAF